MSDEPPSAGLARIERPLVALEEDGRGQSAQVGEIVVQELALVAAAGVRRDVAGHDLLVGPGDVPAELRSRPGRTATRSGCGPTAPASKSQPVRARLAFGVDRVRVHPARPAGRDDDVDGVEEDEAAVAGRRAGSGSRATAPTTRLAAPRPAVSERDDLVAVEDAGSAARRTSAASASTMSCEVSGPAEVARWRGSWSVL